MQNRSPLEDWKPTQPVQEPSEPKQPEAKTEPAQEPAPAAEPAKTQEPATPSSDGADIDDSSLKGEEVKNTAEPAPERKGTTVSFSAKPKPKGVEEQEVLSFLSEKLGREIKSVEDITPSEFANEQVKAINDFVKTTGRGIEDYIATQTQNFDEMSDAEVLRFNMIREGYSQAEADKMIAYKYKQDSDSFSDIEIETGLLEMKGDARQARAELNQLKEQYASENVAPVQFKEKSLNEKYYGSDDGFAEAFNESLNQDITVTLGSEGNEWNWDIPEEAKQAFAESFESLDDLIPRNEDGSIDTNRLIVERLILNNIDSVVEARATVAKSQGKEEVVKDLKNVSNNDTTRDATGATTPTSNKSAMDIWVDAQGR